LPISLPVGVSADASCALAFAADVGIEDGADALSPSSAATSVAGAFLSLEDFSATLLDLRCAKLFEWREPCLTYLLSAIGSAAALSVFELAVASSAPAAAACGGPPRR